jgi:hypothetical protein
MLRHIHGDHADADGRLRDTRIAARHADLRTMMRCDRASENFGRRP